MPDPDLVPNSINKQVKLEAQPPGEQTNSLNQPQNPSSQRQITANQSTNANPLDDHDYCSPNKGVPNKSKSQQLDPTINNNSIDRASTSTSLTKPLNEKAVFSTEPINNSTSPSASSPCSSERSNGLVIAQEHNESKIKSELIAPQPTPPIKRKPGRPPISASNIKKKNISSGPGLQDSVPKPKRERSARQSTSVTDKSQWIVGDEEIDSALSEHADLGAETREKRQRVPKELDSAFGQYTSSDYSSSDAESDEEEENEESCDEDDPNRLWCICQKPHDGKFMICCDICKDWFHGQCVGVPKLMGDRFVREGKEWFCSDCQEKLKSGIPRAAISEKIVKNEKKKKKSASGRRGRGRPRKSETSTREPSARLSLRSARKSTSSLDPKIGVDNGRLKRNLSRTDARSESYDEFQDSQRLKELIRERKKAFFYKRQLAAEQKAARRTELGLGSKQTLTASLGDSLDSLATSTSSPNMSNLPINIKERSKPNIVLQINMKKDSASDQNNTNSRIVTTIVRSPKKSKHVDSSNPAVNDLFTADPIQINKKSVVKQTPSTTTNSTPIVSTNATNQVFVSNGGESGVRKRTSSTGSPPKKQRQSEQVDASMQRKKRKDSESSLSNGATTPGGSIHVVQRIKETLEGRGKEISDLKIGSDEIEKIATEIEAKLNENFKEGTHKYRSKYSSILFNLKDKKNLGLVKSVLTEVISPSKLVNMSSEELASSELAKWRERENKHSIELIKRDAQLAAQQVIVKKTHKGEEVISAPLPNEPDDPSVTMDNQETPTTPNKLSTKDLPRVDGSKIILTPPVIKPPTIKSFDLDSLPPIENERSPNHPNRSPGLDEYEQQRESSGHVNEVSDTFDSTPEPTWSGLVTMPDIEKFSVSAKPVCGLANLKKDQISETLAVCGRIPPDQVQSYLKKLKTTTKHQILMIQLFPLTHDDKPKFDTLFDYLYSRNRYGVIQTNPSLFKDFYIIPIHDKGSIPDALKPTVSGPGIDRKEPNCLIGLLVKFIRRQSTGSASITGSTSESNVVYTPSMNQ